MENFYFTYGTDEKMPFRGGWTMIQAPNIKTAARVFKAYHPNSDDSEILNCADYYTEEAFKRTRMSREGNFGKYCVETIICMRMETANDEQ